MCDQARTVAVCWWTEPEEIAFSQEIGICAEVNFTYPSTTHPPPFKAPGQSTRNGERLNIEYVFLLLLKRKMKEIPWFKKKKKSTFGVQAPLGGDKKRAKMEEFHFFSQGESV